MKGNVVANYVTIRGFVSSDFVMRNTPTGLVIGNFRMGSNDRRQDTITKEWHDGHTNWYHISAFRSLAQNAVSSIHKGDRILVMGKMTIKTYLRKDGTEGTSVEIEADSIGPDLRYGTAHYTRMSSAHPVGQGDSPNDGHLPRSSEPTGDGADGGTEVGLAGDATVTSESETYRNPNDSDDPENSDNPNNSDDETVENELYEGEHLDLQTGEILREPAPF